MNNKFEWNRFCKVVNKDFRNMWPMFGPTMLILAALPFALWLLMYVLGGGLQMPADFRLMMIEGLAMLAAVMTPSRLYRTWNLRNEGIYYAMLPASKLEKFCSALLFSVVICPLAVYLGGMLLDIFLTALPFGPWYDWLWQGQMGFPFTFNLSYFQDLSTTDYETNILGYYGTLWVVACWIGYISSVMMFLFTSTIFKKHKVLQTILWLYVIEFIFSIVLIPVLFSIFNNVDFAEAIVEYFTSKDPQLLFNWFFWVAIVFNIVLTILFGWLGWRRLKKMPY